MTAPATTKRLPTGGCNYNFPDLSKDTTCGCQKFSLRKSKRSAWGKGKAPLSSSVEAKRSSRASTRQQSRSCSENEGPGSEDDIDSAPCRCGHDACYHSGHPAPTSVDSGAGQKLPDLEGPQGSARYGGPTRYPDEHTVMGRKLSISTAMDDPGRIDRSTNAVALSAISGTTTERDPSTAGTPMVPAFKHGYNDPRGNPGTLEFAINRRVATRTREELPRLAGNLQAITSQGTTERQQINTGSMQRPPSAASGLSSRSEKQEFLEKLKRLIEYTTALKNNQMSHQDRIEMIETLPSALEDLAEKVELLDGSVDEKLYSFETRLMNEFDDRTATIESFIKMHGEKRKRRYTSRALSEGYDNSSSVQGDRKRSRRSDLDGSEIGNNEPLQGLGVTTTTTTNFTTTTSTSSFSTSSQVAQPRAPKHVDDLKILSELELFKSRLSELEASAPPSVARPWVVEIVLIPPAPLKSIWAEVGASAPNTQHTGSEVVSASASTMANVSTPRSSGMVPYTFSPVSKVYKRLQSRGFVKRLHITGPSARDVALVIETYFQDQLEWCHSFALPGTGSKQAKSQTSNASSRASSRGSTKAGTRITWYPLRKIYKQPALEYLPSSDLSSPALWTVDYLKANCVMRGATRRVLYILPSFVYPCNSIDISWNDIKKLEPYEDHDNRPEVAKGTTLEHEEAFWGFDPKLDVKPTEVHSPEKFFSGPSSSFGPFPSDTGSIAVSPMKLSFSAHFTGLSPRRQEATPPATGPHLRSRLSNRMDGPHLSEVAAEQVPEKAFRSRTPVAQENVSPKSVKSAPHPKSRRSEPSPPSPPLSYPLSGRRRKKVTASGSAKQSAKSRKHTTAVEASTALSSNSIPFQRTTRGLGDDFMTTGVGRWQEGIGEQEQERVIHHGWEDAEGPGLEGTVDPGGGSGLEGTVDPGGLGLEGTVDPTRSFDLEGTINPADMEWGSLFASVEPEEPLYGSSPPGGDITEEEVDDDDENTSPEEATPSLPQQIIGDSGDGGYHSG
jgi:hypothetical protein